MAKPSKKNEGREAVQSLMAALTFAKAAYQEIGEPYQTHVILWDRMIYSFNGTLATGHPIEEDIRACPQGTALRTALARCKDAVALGVADGSLTVKSGRFRATIPCIDWATLQQFAPDPVGMPLDDTVKAGFAILEPLIKEGAALVLEAALQLQAGSMTATNRATIVEFWHGYPVPFEALIPKAAVKAVLASPYKLAGYGASQTSVTFWFENKSWIKTQLFVDKYPDVGPILNKKTDAKPLPADFMEGIKTVLPFANDAGHITYGSNGLHSGTEGAKLASYEIDGIEREVKTSGYQWELVGNHVKAADWLSHDNAVFFFGDRIRGAIAKTGR